MKNQNGDYLGLKENAIVYNDIEGFGFIEADIINKNIKNKKNNLIKNIEKTTKEDVLRDFKGLLKNFDFIDGPIVEYEIVDDTDFVMKQHEFLNNSYIVVDISDNILKIINYEKKAFIIDMSKISKHIYAVVIEAYFPRKIFTNTRSIFSSQYLDGLSINSPYDISHIIKMFYTNKFSNLKELVELFIKKISISDDNSLSLLFNLFQIKTGINNILEKYCLMSLINKEMKFISVMCKIESIGLPFSQESYDEFLKSIIEAFETTAKALQETYGVDFREKINNKDEFLNMLHELELFPSKSKEFWLSRDNIDLQGFLVAHELMEKYKTKTLNLSKNKDRLFIEYNFYDNYGNVKPLFNVDGYYIKCKEGKNIVVGTFIDLYYRIFANLTNLEVLTSIMNENKFIEKFANKAFKNTSPAACFNATNILKAYIEGYYKTEDLADYFFIKKDTKFENESMSKIQGIFNKNINETIKFIKKFYRDQSKDKRFCFTDESSLHQYIKMTEADIFKTAILDINESVTLFNENNKYKIHLIGVQGNKIILECDDNALNIAIDILNRKLTKTFDSYLKRVQAVCNVVSSTKLKG